MGGRWMIPEMLSDYHLPALSYTWQDKRFILGEAESLLGKEYPSLPCSSYMAFTQNGDRIVFEEPYFRRRNMLCTFILAEALEGKGRFLPSVLDGLWFLLEESTWCLPAHNVYKRDDPALPFADIHRPVIDLFAAESGSLLACCLSLLKGRLPETVAARMEESIRERIVQPYLHEDFWWMARGGDPRPCNWSPWCTQNVLLAFFLTKTSQNERHEAFSIANSTLSVYAASFPDDGCCSEGAEYYRRSALSLFFALSLMDQVSSHAYAWVWKDAKLKKMTQYIQTMHVDGRYYVNWGDCSACPGLSGVREYLFGKAVGSPSLMAFAKSQLCIASPAERLLQAESDLFIRYVVLTASEEAMAYAGTEEHQPWVDYPSLGVIVVRSGGLVSSVKADANGGSHQHNDGGSLTVFKEGKPLLIDVGVETYTQKTFSSGRYAIWTMRSPWHNVANPKGLEQLPDGGKPSVKRDGWIVTLDLSCLYPPQEGFSYIRTVDFSHGLLVHDHMEGREEGVLTLMSVEKPVCDGMNITFGSVAQIVAQGGGHVEVEELPVTDARLKRAWQGPIYRTLLDFKKDLIWMLK